MTSVNKSSLQRIKSLAKLFLVGFFVLGLAKLVTSFFGSQSYINGSDYIQFYVAGKLFAAHNYSALYPIGANGQFDSSHFREITRLLFPDSPSNRYPLFLYPPAAGMIFLPLSFLPWEESFFIWKLISAAAVIFSCFCLTKAYRQPAKFMLVLLFYFVALFIDIQTIVIGQTTLLFALLPLTVGHIFWRKKKNFAAGLTWSLLCLKPQALLVLLPVFFVAMPIKKIAAGEQGAAICSFKELLQLGAGLFAGGLVLNCLAAYVFDYHLYISWLAAAKAWQQHIFDSHNFQQSSWQIVSLAGALSLAVPDRIRTYTLAIAPWSAVVCFAFELWILARVACAYKLSQLNRKDLLLSLSLFFLPLSSFYMTKPDLCLLIIPLWLSLLQGNDKLQVWRDLFNVSVLFGLLVEAHQLLSLLPNQEIVLRGTLLLVACLIGCVIWLSLKTLRALQEIRN